MIILNNKIYLKKIKANAGITNGIAGYYKKNRRSLYIYNLEQKLCYAIRLNDGMVCNASRFDNGKNWFQYHFKDDNFNDFVTNEELKMLQEL